MYANGYRIEIYYKFMNVLGTYTTRPSFYRSTINLPRLLVGNKIFLSNVDFIPFNVGRYDWNKKVVRLFLHEEGTENTGRRDAGNDKAKSGRAARTWRC